jgi:hypothetical protein
MAWVVLIRGHLGMINITGVDLVKFAQKAYSLSVPQGMGFIHYTSDPLTDDEARGLIKDEGTCNRVVLDMDYVKGRACKITVFRTNGRLLINDSWYDHTDWAFEGLLESFGFDLKSKAKHGLSCGCVDCGK